MKNFYAGKRILVTGATGYLGSCVLRALSDWSCEVKVLQTDIRDENIWPGLLKDVDIIFHFAAQTSAYVANEDPVNDVKVNVLPVAALLAACSKHHLRPDIIFSGTVTQAGLTQHWPVNESVKDDPLTVYDIHKLTVEHYLRYYSRQLGGRAVTLRLANLYGPGPSASSSDRGILNKMVEKALQGKPLTVYGDGNFIRDYIFIDDVARAFLAAGAHIDALKGNYYVIGSGKGHTVADMAQIVAQEAARHTGKSVAVEHVPAPEGLSPIEFRNFVADTASFSSLTGWQAEVDLTEGVRRTIQTMETLMRQRQK